MRHTRKREPAHREPHGLRNPHAPFSLLLVLQVLFVFGGPSPIKPFKTLSNLNFFPGNKKKPCAPELTLTNPIHLFPKKNSAKSAFISGSILFVFAVVCGCLQLFAPKKL